MAATVAGRAHRSGAASSASSMAAKVLKRSSRSTTLPLSILMATFVVVMLGTASCWAQSPPPPPSTSLGLGLVINLSPITVGLVGTQGTSLNVTVPAGATVTVSAGTFRIVNVVTNATTGPITLNAGSVVYILPGLHNTGNSVQYVVVGRVLGGVFAILQSLGLV